MYSALSVARYIIMRCNALHRTISNLKLQKILYFVQAEFLVTKDCPCFPDRIEAWDFGPVVPSVYHEYKFYGSSSIPFTDHHYRCPFGKEDQDLMDGIINECSQYSASTLVEITHHQTPWQEAYHSGYKTPISNTSIKYFFKECN